MPANMFRRARGNVRNGPTGRPDNFHRRGNAADPIGDVLKGGQRRVDADANFENAPETLVDFALKHYRSELKNELRQQLPVQLPSGQEFRVEIIDFTILGGPGQVLVQPRGEAYISNSNVLNRTGFTIIGTGSRSVDPLGFRVETGGGTYEVVPTMNVNGRQHYSMSRVNERPGASEYMERAKGAEKGQMRADANYDKGYREQRSKAETFGGGNVGGVDTSNIC